MFRRALLVLSASTALVLGCTPSKETAPSDSGKSKTEETQTVSLAEGEHLVCCGCAIDGVGKCGNFVQVDGHYVPLAGDVGLGKMAFCGKGEKVAKVEGAMADGKFVATSIALKD